MLHYKFHSRFFKINVAGFCTSKSYKLVSGTTGPLPVIYASTVHVPLRGVKLQNRRVNDCILSSNVHKILAVDPDEIVKLVPFEDG